MVFGFGKKEKKAAAASKAAASTAADGRSSVRTSNRNSRTTATTAAATTATATATASPTSSPKPTRKTQTLAATASTTAIPRRSSNGAVNSVNAVNAVTPPSSPKPTAAAAGTTASTTTAGRKKALSASVPPRSTSPLKSAMKSSNRFSTSSSTTSPRARQHYVGPIDVDEIPRSTPFDADDMSHASQELAASLTLTLTPTKTNVNVNASKGMGKIGTSVRNYSARNIVTATPAASAAPPPVPAPPFTVKSAVKKNPTRVKVPMVSAVPSSPGLTNSQTEIESIPATITPTYSTSKDNKATLASTPFSITKKSPSKTFGRASSFENNSNDNISVVTTDNKSMASMMSRVSVYMDHFLAEMAMADNTQLEALAVEEMKHRQIIPQKIKKLNAKISVLHEERDVLVGLIDQLSELVNNQERNHQRKREKKQQRKQEKAKKKALKKQKKQELKARLQQHEEQQQQQQQLQSKAADGTPTKNHGSDSDHDEIKNKTKTTNWWAPDDSDPALGVPKADDADDNSDPGLDDPLLGGDDEFAKLWDDEFMPSNNNAPNHNKNKNKNNSKKPQGRSGDSYYSDESDKDKDKDKQKGDKNKNDSNNKDKPRHKLEAFTLVEALPDRLDDDNDLALTTTAPTVSESDDDDDQDKKFDLPASLKNITTTPTNNNFKSKTSAAQSSYTSKSFDSADEEEKSSGQLQPHQRSKQRDNRFSMFHETETYLPDHMPGSRGNSPHGSQKGDGSDSDSDNHSDSDDDHSSRSSLSGDGAREVAELMDDEEDNPKPSVSHHLAKQLMARLKQQENKQHEQEELQLKLAEQLIRRNSERNFSDAGSEAAGGSVTNLNLMMDPTSIANSLQGRRRLSLQNYGALSASASAGSLGAAARPTTISLNGGLNNGGACATSSNMMQNNGQNQTYLPVVDDMVGLRKVLLATQNELEQLRMERAFQEAKVRELLAVLDQKFDDNDEDHDDDDEDDDDDDNNNNNNNNNNNDKSDLSKDEAMETSDNNNAAESTDEAGTGKKRKRMQQFLTQKVTECAELTATVEQLKEEVAKKQAKIDELHTQQTSGNVSSTLQSIGTKSQGEASPTKSEDDDEQVPGAPRLSMPVSTMLGTAQIHKQLLEKSGECIDLQEQIEKLKEIIAEKDKEYQEVHRDLFTANLALGVEVDKKAHAQEALHEKTHEFEEAKAENDELKAKLAMFEERQEKLDEDLLTKSTHIDLMTKRHDDDLRTMSAKVGEKESEISTLKDQLESLEKKVDHMESHYEQLKAKEISSDKELAELRQLLDLETDTKQVLEEQVKTMEKEKEELKAEVARLAKENEINKTLLNGQNSSGTAEGEVAAHIQAEVEKLINENAELTKSLKTIRDSEASLLSERERLVANATNMSIMLADSRAKVDFLQMQLEEYKNGAMSNSGHGVISSQSEHGFSSSSSVPGAGGAGGAAGTGSKRGFRKLIANSVTGAGGAQVVGGSGPFTVGGSSLMGDSSERSAGDMGSSKRGERSARFRSFLQNRMNRPGQDQNAAPAATTGGTPGEKKITSV